MTNHNIMELTKLFDMTKTNVCAPKGQKMFKYGDYVANPAVYETLCNQPIKYIYADKEPGESGDNVIYVEVKNPYDDEE